MTRGETPPAQLNAPLLMRDVVRRCAKVFDVGFDDLIGATRIRYIANARQATAYILHELFPKRSHAEIGRVLGHRDHTTIIHAIRITQERLAQDPEIAGKIKALIESSKTAQSADLGYGDSAEDLKQRAYDEALIVLDGGGERGAPVLLPPRSVKPKNDLSPDDKDAFKRFAGSEGLSAAINAGGGWPS